MLKKSLQSCRILATRFIQGSASMKYLVTDHINEKFSITLLGVEVPVLVITQEQYSVTLTGQH